MTWQADPRIEVILNLLLEIAGGNLDARAAHSDTGDELDAIIETINMLAEELNASVVSKTFLESILQSMIDMLLVVNRDGSIRIANRAICQALDSEPHDVVGRPLSALFVEPVCNAPAISVNAEQPIQATHDLELTLRAKSGQTIPVVVNCSPISGATGLVIAARDLSERVKAQRRIEHLNQVLRAVRNGYHLLVQEKNLTRMIEGICGHLLEIERYQRAWVVLTDAQGNKGVQWIEADHRTASTRSSEWLVEQRLPPCAIAALAKSEVLLKESLYPACQACPLAARHLTGIPMVCCLQHEDRVFGLVGVTVASNGGLEPEERMLFQELAQEIGFAIHRLELEEEHERERARLEEQLRHAQKMEAVGRLAGGIAHDFNNILTSIINCARLVQEAMNPFDPAREDAVEIEREGRRAAALIQQLLAFGRRSIIQPQTLNLNAIISVMQRMLRRILGEDITMRLELAPSVRGVVADPGHLEQVIANLVVNARDAMPEGGTLTIETKDVTLDEAFTRSHLAFTPGPYVMLAISDTGHGMPAEVREHIFEPFFTTKGEGKGTGLGLATVYAIVKQFGGQVWVYSEPGLGTTFKIYLPAAQTAGAAETNRRPEPAVVQASQTILLVEDEEAVRGITRRLLERRGFTVLAAGNGQEALQTAKEHSGKIDVVLTDVVLPGLSGKLLVEQLRQQCPAVAVVYMSGYTDNAIVHHGVLDPGIFFVQKPFELEDLIAKVQEALAATNALAETT